MDPIFHRQFGKILMALGIVMFLAGILLYYRVRIPWMGRLPGDIAIERDHFRLYIPLATGILLSILLTLIFSLFRK